MHQFVKAYNFMNPYFNSSFNVHQRVLFPLSDDSLTLHDSLNLTNTSYRIYIENGTRQRLRT